MRTIELSEDEIAIIWSTEDVKMQCEWLDDDQAYEVLHYLDHNHDACFGVNWDTIQFAAERLFPEPGENEND